MKDVKGVFRNLEKMLEKANWFEDGWEIYNRGEYLQLYKQNWFNENQGGVHFETFIEGPQIKQKHFRFACTQKKIVHHRQNLFVNLNS